MKLSKLYSRTANSLTVLGVTLCRCRDKQTLRSLQWAWRLHDVHNGIDIPIPGTHYTVSFR